MSLNTDISCVLKNLSALERKAASLMNPPTREGVVADQMAKLELDAPTDMVLAYEVNNGTRVNRGDSLDDAHFFPGFYWLSLQDAVTVYKSIANDLRWNKNWFPFFSNGGGDFYAVDCRDGSIVGFILGEEIQDVEFLSLNTMMRTICECFEREFYFVEDGRLKANFRQASIVAAALNPGLSFYEG